ncbi:hypothetical protein GPECTOR_1g587 [Gonium pectorale]|uniref:Uncharacterized protein n=1 Tax=Gonium pectorale TaxID=33097 RepID=A0A150H3K7_GONPE|nr:hypothetical protein GPECTOR_1g587 [Gonium pectorale]|eukprot:KXZ56651.1 hypothetical protein GPECTOR_1g587 [Gonium pectorale]
MDGEGFQRENFKLREQEYRYYAEANRDKLPRVPDLADNAGGLSNPTYFNFVWYCLWKVVYKRVLLPEEREQFARECAAEFLARVWTGDHPQRKAALATGGATPQELILTRVLPFLDFLKAGGYLCHYQVVMGSHPGGWPADWMVREPVIVYAEPEGVGADAAAAMTSAAASGGQALPPPQAPCVLPGEILFQLKLHQPADILGSVALRSEEGGSWPHTLSSCLSMLLMEPPLQGCGTGETCDGEATARGPGADPGDPRGDACESVLPESKQPRVVVECDEYFYADRWQGPKSLRDRLLLLLGDPLEQVGVDFVPSTLVQNWRFRSEA